MILAPATMTAEKDPKEAARKCLEEVGLDPESYRIGHTKARTSLTYTGSADGHKLRGYLQFIYF